MNGLDKRIDLDAHVAKITDVLQHTGDRYVIVEHGLADDVARGAALKAAYSVAKGMSPSEATQVWVLIPPGAYDVGDDGLVLDTEWINVSGLVPAKVVNAGKSNMVLEPTILIYGAVSATNSGVIKQTANNVIIRDIEIKNTAKEVELNWDHTDPAVYWPTGGEIGTSLWRVKITGYNGHRTTPWATRLSVEYAQTWEECLVCGEGCIGGYGGRMSGTIINCTISGTFSVVGNGGIISGTIANCAISGYGCVGGSGSIVSGTITNCAIGGYCCVGGNGGIVSGKLMGCTISGDGCVGGYGGTVSGTIAGCMISGDGCVGGHYGTVSGGLSGCTINGDYCVGGNYGIISGALVGCTIGGHYCVGGYGGHVSGFISHSIISGHGCVGSSSGTLSCAIENSIISGDYSVGGYGTVSATAWLMDVSMSGAYALCAIVVDHGAEFIRVSGVPTDLPSAGGKYLDCVLTDGTVFSGGFGSETK